jgi:acyl-CoA thioesterase-2
MHAYFLRPGDVSRPIVYEVDRIRDGGSFTTRRVRAIQRGHPIFHLSASFQVREAGFDHQDAMPDAPPPESLPTEQERIASRAHLLPPNMRERALAVRPFELRAVDRDDEDLLGPPAKPRGGWSGCVRSTGSRTTRRSTATCSRTRRTTRSSPRRCSRTA